jgi:hypothetical protein
MLSLHRKASVNLLRTTATEEHSLIREGVIVAVAMNQVPRQAIKYEGRDETAKSDSFVLPVLKKEARNT